MSTPSKRSRVDAGSALQVTQARVSQVYPELYINCTRGLILPCCLYKQ